MKQSYQKLAVTWGVLLLLGCGMGGLQPASASLAIERAAQDVRSDNPEVQQRLEKAREDLALAEASERRVLASLSDLKAAPDADTDIVRAYETYASEIAAMVKENRDRVKKLEALIAAPEVTEDEVDRQLRELDAQLEQLPDPSQEKDPIAALDAELDASMEEYDAYLAKKERLLKARMDKVDAAAASGNTSRAQAAAEAAELLRKMGVEPGSTVETSGKEAGTTTSSGQQSSKGKAAGEAGTNGENTDNQGASAEQSAGKQPSGAGNERGNGGAGSERAPRQNEDIVARQLREAAENEKDPVLREKLWKEYDDYVSGGQS